MARETTTYDTVEAWTQAEFSCSLPVVKNLSERTLAQSGLFVDHVHPNSPAGQQGILRDDILFAIQGASVDEVGVWKTFKGRLFGRAHTFDFFRPSTSEAYRIKGQCFPFGCRLSDSHYSMASAFRNGDTDPSLIEPFWKRGDHDVLATLHLPFEIFNIRMRDLQGRPFDGPAPKAVGVTDPLADYDDVFRGFYAYLALCAAAAGALDRARYVLDQVYHYYDTTDARGMMSSFATMEYAESLIAEAQSDTSSAIDHIHKAIEMAPEISQLYRRLSTLTGANIPPPLSPFIGVKPAYKLPRHDPAQKFPQENGAVNISDCVAKLAPGQFILLCAMSAYRTNTPYENGFRRALVSLSRLQSQFQEVHVVTSFAFKDTLHCTVMEPILRKAGVNVSVLFDESDSLSDQLSLISSPTNLIIDHRGIVVAEGWLGDDEVLWDAIATK